MGFSFNSFYISLHGELRFGWSPHHYSVSAEPYILSFLLILYSLRDDFFHFATRLYFNDPPGGLALWTNYPPFFYGAKQALKVY